MNKKNFNHCRLSLSLVLLSFITAQQSFAENSNNPATFHLILSQPGSCVFDPSPYISNETIYIGDYSGIVSAINQNSGLFSWRYRTNVKDCVSTVLADKDSIYFTTTTTNSSYNTVYSLNNLTGEEHWEFKDGYEHRTPIVIDGNLLYYGDDMVFTAVNKNTRKIEWNFVDSKMKFSPGVIYNDDIIFGGSQTTFPPAGHGVYSINKMTGKIQWTFDGGHKKNNDGNDINEDFPNASCVIDDTVYASGSFGNVYAINANTGALKWKYAYTTDDPRDTPICSDDTVYIGTGVDYKKGALYAINAKTGKLKWQYNTEERASPPYINNGSIYFGSVEYPPYPADPKDYLYALDLQGNIKWKFEADGYVRSAPIADKGIVYFITESGSLYAINAITGKL